MGAGIKIITVPTEILILIVSDNNNNYVNFGNSNNRDPDDGVHVRNGGMSKRRPRRIGIGPRIMSFARKTGAR